jgi:hypothetical protein
MKECFKRLLCKFFGHRFFSVSANNKLINVICSRCNMADEDYMIRLLKDLERHIESEGAINDRE